MSISSPEAGNSPRPYGSIRFLFAMFQGGGNIPLIMPIVSALIARGHAVRVIAGPGIRPSRAPVSDAWTQKIKDSGAQLVSFDAPEIHPYDAAPPLKGVGFGWMPSRFRNMAATEVRTTLWARAWAANVSDHLRMAETDVLVSDFCLFGALAAGEASGLPTAAIVHNAFHPHASGLPAKGLGRKPAHSPLEKVNQAAWQWMYYRIWARDGSPMLNQARADLGLPALRSPFHQYDYATRVLILGSREFDFPARLQSNVRYVGTPIDDANVPSDSWKSPWPEDTRTPLVLVSLSTLNQGQGPLLHRILEALDGMSVHAIVTLGPSMDKEQFRPPSNTVLETFVPHSAILPHVEAMVTQCGLGSMTKALSCGVPLVCIPVIGEQRDNAVRVEAKGAGIRLDAGASSDQIREAIKRIITEENFRMAARELASRMTTGQAAENAACEELEAIALLTARKAAQS